MNISKAASVVEAAFLWGLDVSTLREIAAAVELIACVVALLGGAEYQFVAASGAAQGSLCGFGCSDGDLLFGNGCGGLHGLGASGRTVCSISAICFSLVAASTWE